METIKQNSFNHDKFEQYVLFWHSKLPSYLLSF